MSSSRPGFFISGRKTNLFSLPKSFGSSAAEINSAVEDWLSEIEQQGVGTKDSRPSRFLRKRIWEKLHPHLGGAKEIVILADSALCFVPWVALPGNNPGTFLLEDYTISTALNAQELYRKVGGLCRCGQSNNSPFCDGTHTKVEFVAE